MFNDYGSYKMGLQVMVLSARADNLNLISRIQIVEEEKSGTSYSLSSTHVSLYAPSFIQNIYMKKYGTHL